MNEKEPEKTFLAEDVVYVVADARNFVPEKEVHLVITSPPYYTHVDYGNENGVECVASYEDYLENLKKVFENVWKVLVDGGTACINVTNMKSRKSVEGKSFLYPIVADTIRFMQNVGFVFFDEIIWVKGWGNNGALKGKPLFGSYPYPPTPKILDSIFEHVLIFKKPGKRMVEKDVKEKSRLTKEEWIEYTRGVWLINPDRKAKHPAVFPLEIPRRLIKLYSFVGDVVYDPFAGTGTTLVASYLLGRKAIGVEVNKKFLDEAIKKWNEITGRRNSKEKSKEKVK
jgi:DNA modification methylase